MNDADERDLPTLGPEGLDPMYDEIYVSFGDSEPIARHFDRSGNPISFRDWGRLRQFAGRDYTIIKQEEIGPYFVSTVWMGIDHSFFEGPPLIFETMVFNRETGESDLDCRRYSTEEQAIAGHTAMANEVALIVAATTTGGS